MDFDLWLPAANPFATPEYLEAVGREAERRGIHGIWVGEHVVTFEDYASRYPYAESGRIPMPPGSGLLEPFTTLAFLAAVTTSVRLGTAMCLLPQRNPVYSAKEVATVDWLSGGRVDLGVGVGWLARSSRPSRSHGNGAGSAQTSTCRCCTPCGATTRPRSPGPITRSRPATSIRNLCRTHPPIHIGGESEAAMRGPPGWDRAGTPSTAPADLPGALAHLETLLGDQGRSRSEITVTVCPYFKPLDASITEQYAEAGADGVCGFLFAMSAEDVPAAFDALDPCLQRARAC